MSTPNPVQDPALPKFEVPLNDKGGSTSKYWYFFFQGLLNKISAGVTQIVAGTNVTITPTSGTGAVTINATGGGGSGTVTSVGLASPLATINVTGTNPVTTTGVIDVDVNTVGYDAFILGLPAAATLTGAEIVSVEQGGTAHQTTLSAVVALGGGGTSPGGVSTDLVFWWQGDVANVSNNKRLPQLFNSNPNMPGYHAGAIVGGGTGTATTLNGKPVLAFPGPTTASAYAFGNPSAVPAAVMELGSTGCTVFFVGSSTSHAATNGILGGTSAPSLEFSISTTGALIVVNSGSAVLATSTTTVAVNTFFQGNATYDAATGNIAFRISRTGAGTTAGTTHPLTLGTSTVGAENVSGAGPLIGFAAEIIAYQRVLSGAEIIAVENYLFGKWAV